jgi:FlaA1/EpsC-like NDP-sugar epimerase
MLVDACLVAVAWYLAFALRFDFSIPDRYTDLVGQTIFIVIGLKIGVFVLSGFYNHWWRYLSIRDMWSIVRGVVLASFLVFIVIYLIEPVENVRLPRSVFITDTLLLLALLTGVRLLARSLMERPGRKGLVARGQEVIVVGAGDAGQLILRDGDDGRSRRSHRRQPTGRGHHRRPVRRRRDAPEDRQRLP